MLLVLLSCLLVALGSAQVRSTVIRIQAEAGVQRVFENEVHASGPCVQLHESEKLGRKPCEHHEILEATPHPPVVRRWPAPATSHAAPRAPPFAPRGPPLTA